MPDGSLRRSLKRFRCSASKMRPLQKSLYILAACSCLCYALFQLSYRPGSSDYVRGSVNSRLLLQKITETPVSTQPAATASATTLLPRVDVTRSLNDEELAAMVQPNIANVPFEIWVKERSRIYAKNHTCAFYPNLFDIKFNNIYWQTLKTTNGTFYLYGAYFDNRPLNALGPTIRILGMIDRIEPTVKTYCQLWFDASLDPVITPVLEYKFIWNKKWGNYKQGVLQPYLMACQLPPSLRYSVPISVSLTEKGCEPATNNLRVINDRPEKKEKFAVCVKGLDFLNEDISVRLVEWIELLSILGADKIFLYELEVHPNISKVLKHYQETGKVVLTPITLPGEQPNVPGLRHMYLKSKITSKRQNELIPYNDCLYRNLYSYDYIVLVDTDEVIMPKNVQTWSELLDIVVAKSQASGNFSRGSYNFRNVYFWDDEGHSHEWEANIPRYMHMLQHVYRSANYTKPNQYVKCFHNVQRVLTLHNHFPIACLNGGCTSYGVEPEDAHLQHYRADCVTNLKKDCDSEYKQHLVRDTVMWRYKEQLIPRVTQVLEKLGFFSEST